jgi:pyruvate dehydrogenase E2 component (dihydrolipoamide acetyltransferase)
MSKAIVELRAKADANALHRADLTNAPFAISNLGMLSVDQFDAFVFHGQTAVLAVGRAIEDRANEKQAWFSLAVDHRVVDGAEAARFLETLQSEISSP